MTTTIALRLISAAAAISPMRSQTQLVELLNSTFGTQLVYRSMTVAECREDRVAALGDFMGSVIAGILEGIRREGPDYTLHSWVGIALLPVIGVHLTGNAGWIRAVWKRRRQHREFGLGILNASFGVLVGVCVFTGFPLWLGWSGATGWSATHTITGFASHLVMFVHLWRNRVRISRLVRPG